MMDLLERVGERERTWLCVLRCFAASGILSDPLRTFQSVDLFARESNDLAISLYESLGYVVFRRVVGYYGGGPKQADEDGLGASLSLSIKCRKLLNLCTILPQICESHSHGTRTASRSACRREQPTVGTCESGQKIPTSES